MEVSIHGILGEERGFLNVGHCSLGARFFSNQKGLPRQSFSSFQFQLFCFGSEKQNRQDADDDGAAENREDDAEAVARS